MPTTREAARQLIVHLPEQATWDDIMYGLYVKQKIKEGLANIEADRTAPHEAFKAEQLGRARATLREKVAKLPWQKRWGLEWNSHNSIALPSTRWSWEASPAFATCESRSE
jgi:hypothetical protein